MIDYVIRTKKHFNNPEKCQKSSRWCFIHHNDIERLAKALWPLFHLCNSQQQEVDILGIQNWTLQEMQKHRNNSSSDDDMKLTSSFSKAMKNESCDLWNVSCFTCGGKGHLTKSCPNNHNKGRKPWCSYCKSTTHKKESCCYKQKDTMKKVPDMEESLFAFKIDDYNLRKTIVPMGLMVDAGAISHIIQDAKKFKNYDQTLQPGNHYMELADGTKTSGVELKRGDISVPTRCR